ncbi:MATE family efflux transporter [Sulfurimonas sp. HSL3-7]|uniref:MATE family efflux transporter n=1 Tax=Sulfonitrofixus jiaomeiensis TaxID=3131938 RepID=UPI0031FA18A0
MQLDLTRGNIKDHMKTLAIPATIGFLFHTLYNVTDTYFAGQVSTQALAALSLSFPVFFMVIAVAGGMSEALTALVGNALGENEKEKAAHYAKNGLLFGLLLSLLLTAVGVFSVPFLMQQLGAEGSYLEQAVGYTSTIVMGTLLFVGTFFANALLNSVGDMVSFRNILIVSFFLNIGLDYYFVASGFGVVGIAYATLVTETLSMLYLLYRLQRTTLLHCLRRFRLDLPLFWHITTQGIPPSANMVFMAIGVYIITYYASPYGESVVAALGIGMRIEQMALMPAVGINMAVLAIVSQNSGARRYERAEEAVKVGLINGAYIAIISAFALIFGGSYFIGLFSSDAEVIAQGVIYLYVEAALVFPFVVIFIYVALLQAIKRPKFIFYLALARQIILPLLLLEIVSYYIRMPLAVWIVVGLIVSFSALVIWWYGRRELALLKKQNETGTHG